ncbi:hypothetical protein HDU81_008799, partial [Chytriomyces hyalinus]
MISQIFPDPELCEYMLLFLGSCLTGIKKEDGRFNIGYGSGANGKTIIQKMMGYVLGPYSGTVNSNLLTAKNNNADAATPGLVSMIGKRFIYMSETEKGTQFNESLVKLLTGGDDITVRKMYNEATVMTPQFKILMVANDLPKFRGEEYSMQRRIAVIPFLSQFVDKIDSTKEGHFYLKNPQLDVYLKNPVVIQATIQILIKYCNKYLESENTDVPKIIRQHTINYIHANDDIELFFMNCFESSNDYEDDIYTMTEIVNHYKVFLASTNKPIPNNLTCRNYPAKLKEKFDFSKVKRVEGKNTRIV